ncbi:MAG: CoA pyrophosphatase [Candidatus Marinimicrobia bacterium]|nr:CoA pyrophosphatase [Candidatus Neomarinimicrobiota bacterium]|tara:strand:+ start:150 stop:785 length:636 start_codon:yes stop_codon:yes gene_type:complete
MMFSSINRLVKLLEERLKEPLPGTSAHLITKVQSKIEFNFPESSKDAKKASVLILLFPDSNNIHFFLTQRTLSVEHHKGQISLPGGTCEKNEKTINTALRETEEEIGVDKNEVEIIGELTPFFTPTSGFIVHPFIGWCNRRPKTNKQTDEVHTLFSASLSQLLNDQILELENWNLRGYETKVPFYNFDGHKVWGVTAAILSEFKLILNDLT